MLKDALVVRQQLLDLYQIQKIDLAIRQHAQRQDALPQRLQQLEGHVGTMVQQLDQLNQQNTQVGDEAQTMRHAVEQEMLKVRKWESRLNDIRNQREYQALLREIEIGKRQNRDAEGKIHELYQQREELEAQIVTLEAKLDEHKKSCAAETKQVKQALAQMATAMQTHQAEREALVPKLPRQVLRRYDAIAQRRGGQGLALVVGGCCTGCNMRLPPQLYNILQRVDTMEQCPCCHRMVIWDQLLPTEAETAEAAHHVVG